MSGVGQNRWVLGARPRTLPAAVVPVFVGTAAAWRVADRLDWAHFVLALVVALALQIATNYANDYFDFHQGADTEQRRGPTRAVQAGLVAPAAMRRAFLLAFGVMAVYLLTFVLSFFGIMVPYIHDGGPIGIAFSLFVIGLAAFNLLLDFDFIERGESYGLPGYFEWYGAMGLVVTLVWLYIEVLRLLSKLNRN